jgi:hypothetical protein
MPDEATDHLDQPHSHSPDSADKSGDDYRRVFKEASPGLVFATLMGSLPSRTAGLEALWAATRYMEGFDKKADARALEPHRQQWQDSLDRIIKQNEVEQQRYNAIWNDAQLSQAEKQAELNAVAASIGDQIAMEKLKEGDLDFVCRLQQDRSNAVAVLELAQSKAVGQLTH